MLNTVYVLHNRQGQFSCIHVLILALKYFIRRKIKLETFLRLQSLIVFVMGKTFFIISGEKLFWTLNISVANI